MTQAGYQASDIDWFVPHQANKRILDGAARKLRLDPARIIVTVDKHANTSAASIPLALAQGARNAASKPAISCAGGHGQGLYLGRRAAALVVPRESHPL